MRKPSWQDELIDSLVTDARPVRRLWRPGVRLGVWLAVVALVAVVVATGYLRADLASRLQSASFLLEAAAMLLAGSLLALEALGGAAPGRRPAPLAVGVIVAAVALAAVLELRQPIDWGWTPDVFIQLGLLCLWRTAALVVLPWAWLLVALRRGAPLASGRAAARARGAAGGLTFVMIGVCCPIGERLHLTRL